VNRPNQPRTNAYGSIAPFPRSDRWPLLALSLSMLLSSLGTSIANVAIPTLARVFDATFGHAQWIVLAYLLAVTSSIVGVGRLGDLIGRRRLLQAGLLLFTAASVVTGLAPTLGIMIAARAAQGLGAAVMMALSLALVSETVPKARTGSAMGLLGTTSAIGTALGPSLGGILIDQLGWPSIFHLNVPLGLVAIVLAHRTLPADRPTPKSDRVAFDTVGTLLLASTLAAYALAVTRGRGHFGVVEIALLAAAAIGSALFVLVEARSPAPLVHVSLFRDARLSAGLVANLLVSTVVMATLVVGPFYLARALGQSTGVVGLVMSMGPLVAALTGVPAGRIVDRVGTRRTSAAGLAAIAVGSCLLSITPEWLGIPGYALPIVVVTAGYALFQTANNTAALRDVGASQRGVVSGTLNLSRNLGLITGASVMGAVFALASGSDDPMTATPASVATGMRFTFAVAAALALVALALVSAARARATHPSTAGAVQ
jgi:EmrB/QacA subfamily drug resistance transporter